ncbi:MAG: L,D-transpeptidase YcbB [Alphaproteobacteria bacterium]|nr:L,D-transpeptidase YcbB [Alphaproteobacteria bacterium]
MRSARFEHLLAGTAVALALAVMPYAGRALAASEAEIAAAVPMPESADLPPPSIRDIAPAKSEAPAEAATKPAAPVDAAAAKPAAAAPAPVTAAVPAPAETVSSVPATDGTKIVTAAVTTEAATVEKLRDQLAAGKFDRILGGKKERATVEAFYSSRDFAPLWIADGVMNDRGKAAAAYLAGVDADGLDPSEYPIPQIKSGMEPEALAEAEIRFTDAVLTFARHAMSGRVHYSRVAADIVYELAKPDPANVLARVAKAQDAGTALDSLNPPQPQYKALKAKLAEMRRGAGDIAKPMIPSGPVLKYGKEKKGKEVKEVLMEDPRVPALRQWFGLKAEDGNTNYDKTLSETVAKFQKENGINPSGQLNAATLEIINGPKREKTVDIIIANMERWRWVPRDLGHTYVMVNIPDYTLRVMRDEKLVWKTKVVVGKPTLPTPLLTAEMKFITVNPTWNVPPSIIQNEYLPALREDPQAMERIGLKVEQDRDGNIRIYQPPGDKNALGRIRFNFPNKFLVYQHDTPDKHLFAHDKRAYSHGCMRVENPAKYGEVLLGLTQPQEHYTAERLQKMFGGSEVNINFPQSIPVHLTYQTAFVDDSGMLEIRDDVYGRDQRLLAILKGSDRKMADYAIDRPRGSSSAPVRMPSGILGGSSGGGFSFFERLFGGSPDPAPRPRAHVGANDRRVMPR